MRTLLALFLILPLTVQGQAIWRNFFVTNQNPRVTVVAGSNATVQASTVGVDQRIFTVNAIPGAGVDTNALNGWLSTNVAGFSGYATNAGSAANSTNFWGVLSPTNLPPGLSGSNFVGTFTGNGAGVTNLDLSSRIATNDNRPFALTAPAPIVASALPMYKFTVGYTNPTPAFGPCATNYDNAGFTVDCWDLGTTNSGTYSYPFNLRLNGSSAFRMSKHGNVYIDYANFYLSRYDVELVFSGPNLRLNPNWDTTVKYDGSYYRSLRFISLAATGNPAVLSGAEPVAAASNGAGSPLILAGGRSTGNAVPGYVEIKTGTIGPSGTTYNGPSTRYRAGETITALTDSTATPIATVGCNTNTFVGGQILYTIFARDATEFQALTGIATFAAVNTNGVHTCTITDPAANQATAATSGTLTATWTIVSNTSTNIALKVAAVSSLTETNLNCRWQLHLNSDGYATVVGY